MNKYTVTFGIDISKDVFDCYESNKGHLQFENTAKVFVKFLQILIDFAIAKSGNPYDASFVSVLKVK